MKFVVWQAESGQWYWRLKARNGKIVADSSESYKSRTHAKKMCGRINPNFPIIEQKYVSP